ncbi:MAG: hypothetical protein ACREF5_03340 [Candidatus Saccharimonadales bacterium]
MIIISIRTDKPEAEIGLFDNDHQLGYEVWLAHRELSSTIHTKLHSLLKSYGKTINDIEGIVAYEGPGSFTGLRIGLSLANALAYSLTIPIVAGRGKNWLKIGRTRLLKEENDDTVLPKYGAPVHITKPKH